MLLLIQEAEAHTGGSGSLRLGSRTSKENVEAVVGESHLALHGFSSPLGGGSREVWEDTGVAGAALGPLRGVHSGDSLGLTPASEPASIVSLCILVCSIFTRKVAW